MNESDTKKVTDYEKKIKDWYVTTAKEIIEKNATEKSLKTENDQLKNEINTLTALSTKLNKEIDEK